MPKDLQALLDLAPPSLTSVLLVILAAIVALLLHAVVTRRLALALGEKRPLVSRFLTKSRVPVRITIIVIALAALVHLSPFGDDTNHYLVEILTVIFIALAAWMAVSFIELAARLHLRRYRLDVEDNLLARKHYTQMRIFKRTAQIVTVIVAVAAALMSFESVRQYGVSILASAGAAGIILGIAAQPVLSNLLAGVQLALTQPIRLDDAVVVEGEWGRIEEITATYVVIRIWDWRRLIVPLRYFIETPFQNWTRERAAIMGSVDLYVDYSVPVEDVRRKLNEIVAASTLWDGDVVNLQVTETSERTITLRALVSARNSSAAWDLRCEVREKLVAYLQEVHPKALPRFRAEIDMGQAGDPMPAKGSAAAG